MKWFLLILAGIMWGTVLQGQDDAPIVPPILNEDGRISAVYETGDLSVTLGEHIRLRLVVRAPSALDIESIPDFADDGEIFEVLEAGEPTIIEDGNGWVYEREDIIVLWNIGQYTTPEQYIALDNGRLLPIQSVTWLVMTQLPTDGEADLRGSFGVRDLPYTPLWLQGLVLGGVALFTSLGVLWLRRRFGGERGAIKGSLAREAISDLVDIGQQGLESQLTYALIANRLRQYVQARRGIQAVEMTTDELDDFLREENKMTRPSRQQLTRILEQADLVKFAQFTPDEATVGKVINFAVRWVEAHEQELAQQSALKDGEQD